MRRRHDFGTSKSCTCSRTRTLCRCQYSVFSPRCEHWKPSLNDRFQRSSYIIFLYPALIRDKLIHAFLQLWRNCNNRHRAFLQKVNLSMLLYRDLSDNPLRCDENTLRNARSSITIKSDCLESNFVTDNNHDSVEIRGKRNSVIKFEIGVHYGTNATNTMRRISLVLLLKASRF